MDRSTTAALAKVCCYTALACKGMSPAELSSGAVLHCYSETCLGTLVSKQCYGRLTVSVCAEQHWSK
jgi:hypothetical protein